MIEDDLDGTLHVRSGVKGQTLSVVNRECLFCVVFFIARLVHPCVGVDPNLIVATAGSLFLWDELLELYLER